MRNQFFKKVMDLEVARLPAEVAKAFQALAARRNDYQDILSAINDKWGFDYHKYKIINIVSTEINKRLKTEADPDFSVEIEIIKYAAIHVRALEARIMIKILAKKVHLEELAAELGWEIKQAKEKIGIGKKGLFKS
ncbi:hypothetical protein ACFL5G_05275 [Candidatus Margulisiibacteriota bacterium]